MNGFRALPILALLLANSAFADPVMLPFAEITANAPAGNTTLQVSGLPGLPHAALTVTSLVPATSTSMSLGVDPVPDNVYGTFPGTGKQFVFISNVYGAAGRYLIVEIAASEAPSTKLYAGIDINGDGKPSLDEQRCASSTSSASAAVARCVVDLRNAGTAGLWALVDVPEGASGSAYSIKLSSGVPFAVGDPPPYPPPYHGELVLQQLHVVGPGHVAAGQSFPLRVFWGAGHENTQQQAIGMPGRYYGAVMIDGVAGLAPGELGQTAMLPLAVTRAEGGNDIADVLLAGDPLYPIFYERRTLYYSAGEKLQHMFVDVPAGAIRLSVSTAYDSDHAGTVTFEAVPVDFPPSLASSRIDAAPPGPVVQQWEPFGCFCFGSAAISLSPGRWYITSRYSGNDNTSVGLEAFMDFDSSQQPLTPGNYYNPQRPGHGIFISRAGGQQVVDWYTYLEDGTPTWYVAQNAEAPHSEGTWRSSLYRVTWDGSSATPTPVGDMVLTTTAPDHVIFSWHLYGETGSETLQLLAQQACVDAGGTVNLDGGWFPPAQPGYGFDALVLPSQQFDALYLYDDTGNPRWLVGSNGPFAASSTVPMVQSTGFCPLCDHRTVTTQPVGNLTLNYADGTHGQMTTVITLNSPLSGTWNIDRPITRLTGTAVCK